MSPRPYLSEESVEGVIGPLLGPGGDAERRRELEADWRVFLRKEFDLSAGQRQT